MPEWDRPYVDSMTERFRKTLEGLSERLEDVVRGRVAPAVEDITIGSGRAVKAAVLFFDIRGFTQRTGSFMPEDLKTTLLMLDCVIPTVMSIVHDHGGYVEKNTGDGIMAILGVGKPDVDGANAALDVAGATFYALKRIINPALTAIGLEPVRARIGIDMGPILLARIGLPTGAARVDRNFLTAVGPAANLASKLQGMAGTDEIWCADLIRANAHAWRQPLFFDVTPANWSWTYRDTATGRDVGTPYRVWHYAAERKDVPPAVNYAEMFRALNLNPPRS